MSAVQKVLRHLEINEAAEKYYNVFKDTISHLPNISPQNIQNVEHHGGDWDTHDHGSIKTWNYIVDGKPEVIKERVEFDDSERAVIINALEGDVFKDYKSFKATYQFLPRGEHSLAVLIIEYEKLNDDSPPPYKYLDLLENVTKDIESHITK